MEKWHLKTEFLYVVGIIDFVILSCKKKGRRFILINDISRQHRSQNRKGKNKDNEGDEVNELNYKLWKMLS